MIILKSEWVLRKAYFKAKLVDNFTDKYKEWLELEDGLSKGDKALCLFLDKMKGGDIVELYQFPSEYTHSGYDYFEKEDDNHVIPRGLFTSV